jgi:hypothetical protein
MQFGCAIYLATVVGIAGAILTSLSVLIWHARTPHDLQANEKLLLSNWKRLNKAKSAR